MALSRICVHAFQCWLPNTFTRQSLNLGFGKGPLIQTKLIFCSPKKFALQNYHHLLPKLVKKPNSYFSKRWLRTSQSHMFPIPPPLLMMFYKLNGLKVLKWISIIAGRSGRKIYSRLPISVQNQISRHKIVFFFIVLLVTIIVYYSYMHHDRCPITGRRRWVSFTKEQMLVLSEMEVKSLSEAHQNQFVDKNTHLYQVCYGLVQGLIESNSDDEHVRNIDWNLNVINDNEVNNAFVLPNGEIYLFTGMIQLMDNWEELAFILSHEMAHAILGHAQEQQSFLVFGELLFIPVVAFLWFWLEDFTAFVTYAIQDYLFPLLFQIAFNLPYSRQLETEADTVGLNMATKACFDPRWAVFLWDKLALKAAIDDLIMKENTDIKFLSTHPSHDERAIMLEDKIPGMLALRNECGCSKLTSNNPIDAAHKLRKFTINIRKRVDIIEEMKLIQAKSSKSESDVALFGKLEKEFEILQSDFLSMLKNENFKSEFDVELQSKGDIKKIHSTKIKSILNIWSSIISGHSWVPLSEKSNEIISQGTTPQLKVSSQKQSRNYYDTAYF